MDKLIYESQGCSVAHTESQSGVANPFSNSSPSIVARSSAAPSLPLWNWTAFPAGAITSLGADADMDDDSARLASEE